MKRTAVNDHLGRFTHSFYKGTTIMGQSQDGKYFRVKKRIRDHKVGTKMI